MNYKEKINNLEEQVSIISEKVILDQERQRLAALDDLTQSILQLSKDNKYIPNIEEGSYLDPSCIDACIEQFYQIIDLLKMIHLDQETLDNFLRYTITNEELLDIKSTKDPRYISLQNDVNELKVNKTKQLDQEIFNLKNNIDTISHEINLNYETVKESCLEVGSKIDDSWKLLHELESIKGENANKEEIKISNNPTKKTYNIWRSIHKYEEDEKYMKKQLKLLEKTKESLETVLSKKLIGKGDARIVENCITLNLLVCLWRKQFIQKNITNLEVFPQIGKFQFQHGPILIVISLESGSISKIQLFYESKRDELIDFELELNEKFTNSKDIYQTLNFITDKLNKIL